jgi:hypothetical protein
MSVKQIAMLLWLIIQLMEIMLMYVMSDLIVLRMNCDYVLMVIFKINLASQSKIVNLMECMTARSHGQEIFSSR